MVCLLRDYSSPAWCKTSIRWDLQSFPMMIWGCRIYAHIVAVIFSPFIKSERCNSLVVSSICLISYSLSYLSMFKFWNNRCEAVIKCYSMKFSYLATIWIIRRHIISLFLLIMHGTEIYIKFCLQTKFEAKIAICFYLYVPHIATSYLWITRSLFSMCTSAFILDFSGSQFFLFHVKEL